MDKSSQQTEDDDRDFWKGFLKNIAQTLAKTDLLIKEIMSYSTPKRWEAARLLEPLEDLKTNLEKTKVSDIETECIEDIVDLLGEANDLGNGKTLDQVVELAVLFIQKNEFLHYQLLDAIITGRLDNVFETLLVSHLNFVGQGEFLWLLDIQMVDYTASEVLDLIEKSVKADPWLLEDDSNQRSGPDEIYTEQLDTEYHQPNCVHKGGVENHQLHSLIAEPQKVSENAYSHEQMRRRVFAYCGLAGISSNWRTGRSQTGRATFHQSNTRVSICMSKEFLEKSGDISVSNGEHLRRRQTDFSLPESSVSTQKRDPIQPPHSTPSILPTKPEDLGPLTDAQADQIELLIDAITRFCKAAAFLQMSQYCCNSFTLIISRGTSSSQSRSVNMVCIAFQTLVSFRLALSNLQARNPRITPARLNEDLEKCSTIGEEILSIFLVSQEDSETRHGRVLSQMPVDYHLHICSLATQFLGLGLVFYTQGHLGPLSTPSLTYDLTDIELLGSGNEKPTISASLRQLTCLGPMVGGPVFVFGLVATNDSSMAHQSSPDKAVDFRSRGVDLTDTWGPGLLISEAGTPYGRRLHAIEIGGGVVRPVHSEATDHDPLIHLYHWSSQYDSYDEMRILPTFSLWDEIEIGAININSACPLDPEKCRKDSQHFLYNLGTRRDYWQLAERQIAFQAGYYTVFQVGNVYTRKLGKTIKQQIIEQWSLFPNLRMLVVPWGLQVSLCTGIAKRVSLRKLIEDSMFIYVDTLKYEQWHEMLPSARAAFQGSTDLESWIKGLSNDEKICLIAVIGHILELLKNTGVDHKGEYLSILWPDASFSSYGVKIKCNDMNAWTRILHDSESCATFATVTSTCLEGHNHACRKMVAPSWRNCGGLLSTAICRDLTTGRVTEDTSSRLQLEDGQRYWIGKVSGDYWVVVRKTKGGDVHLIVKCNRFPKVLSQTFWKSNVIREMPDVNFEAIDVLVLGSIAGY